MTQLEGLTILVDGARQLPETKHLTRALKWADRRLETLKARKARRDAKAALNEQAALEAANEPMPKIIPAYIEGLDPRLN